MAFVPCASTAFLYGGTDGSNSADLNKIHDDLVSNNTGFGQRSFFAPMNNKSTVSQREKDIFSSFSVFNELYDTFNTVSDGSNLYANNRVFSNQFQESWTAQKPLLVTYPSVEFTVTGYTQVKGQNYIFNTETTGGQPIIT